VRGLPALLRRPPSPAARSPTKARSGRSLALQSLLALEVSYVSLRGLERGGVSRPTKPTNVPRRKSRDSLRTRDRARLFVDFFDAKSRKLGTSG